MGCCNSLRLLNSRLAAWGPSTLENTRAATVPQLNSPPHTFSVSFIHLTHSWNSFLSLSTEFTIEINVWCMVISYRLQNFTCNLELLWSPYLNIFTGTQAKSGNWIRASQRILDTFCNSLEHYTWPGWDRYDREKRRVFLLILMEQQ